MAEYFLIYSKEALTLILPLLKDMQPGRLIESLIFLVVLLARMKPHFKKVEDRMLGLENGLKSIRDSVNMGFSQGNARFSKIETRLDILEHKEPKKAPEVSQ